MFTQQQHMIIGIQLDFVRNGICWAQTEVLETQAWKARISNLPRAPADINVSDSYYCIKDCMKPFICQKYSKRWKKWLEQIYLWSLVIQPV